MHRFQPSRGRILFEVFCALAVVASMVGAWRQTNASALLTAAAAAGLYAMVRLFDLGRNAAVQAEEPQLITFERESQDVQPVMPAASQPLTVVELPVPQAGSQESEQVEPAPRASAGRRKGGSRKGGGRRASSPKAKLVEDVPAEVAEPELDAVVDVQPEVPELASPAEPVHVPHAPLFEPEPFVRMPRQAFGRRGRI
ncbi:MAG: hypothetical protein M3Q19_10065 [Pseudomonadota bacterium]|nr:hypothetical protein [Pseudomonadota bacterium]